MEQKIINIIKVGDRFHGGSFLSALYTLLNYRLQNNVDPDSCPHVKKATKAFKESEYEKFLDLCKIVLKDAGYTIRKGKK